MGGQMFAECGWRELIIDHIEIIAGLYHFMALGCHLAHETFQDVGYMEAGVLSRKTFW